MDASEAGAHATPDGERRRREEADGEEADREEPGRGEAEHEMTGGVRRRRFAQGLVRDAIEGIAGPDGLSARTARAAALPALTDPRWSQRLSGDDADARALGCVLFTAAHELGAADAGWRHERRAYEHLVRAAFARHPHLGARGIEPADLPDLPPAPKGAPRAERGAFELAFWIDRHLLLGARRFAVVARPGGLLVRADLGGDPCVELGAAPRASTRRGAWLRLAHGPREGADRAKNGPREEGDQRADERRRRLRP